MDRFPEDVRFRGRWRVYQQRVLDELEGFLEDEHLHVVAAPGSGKTTLGLEVVRRLDAATLILAPTITIRDQWAGRLVGHFLPEGSERPDWLSSNLKAPGFVTVVTYQALHAASTGKGREKEHGEDDDEALEKAAGARVDVPTLLRQAGVKTLVVDEAHHLRTEWWRVLTDLTKSIEGLRVVALTATPPYDVPQGEWQRYRELCGPVDTEVPVPELVAHGDLCPHQDLVRLSTPSAEEGEQLRAFRSGVESFAADLRTDSEFLAAVLAHPWTRDPAAHQAAILGETPVFTSMLIYLKAAGLRVPKAHLRVLHMSQRGLPVLGVPILEVLLEHLLGPGAELITEHAPVLDRLRNRLKRIGAIERRKLRLTGTRALDRLLATSVTKLDSVVEVVRAEAGVMGESLRLVVLTDFVRREDMPKDPERLDPLKRLGVVPIFEGIRRASIGRLRAGILSGSLVVLPETAVQPLRDAAAESGVPPDRIRATPYSADPGFVLIRIDGADRKAMVRLVTRLFIDGHVTTLVGTAALLGEGWDAPVINSLVLASYVGSYMLSNQMRGRAIRTVAGEPDKTANIWHLLCVETDQEKPGDDHATLTRRFRAFTGPADREPVIRNGLARLNLQGPPWSADDVERVNAVVASRAVDRETLRERWKEALDLAGPDACLVEEIRVPADFLPRWCVLRAARFALISNIVLGLVLAGSWVIRQEGSLWARGNATVAFGLAFVAVVLASPWSLLVGWRAFQHRTWSHSLRRTGRAVLEALHRTGKVTSDPRWAAIHAEHGTVDDEIRVDGWMTGGSTYDRSLWADTLAELLDPIKRARYVLSYPVPFRVPTAPTQWFKVPKLLAKSKADAAHLESRFRRRVGRAYAIYVRKDGGERAVDVGLFASSESRRYARGRSSERIVVWR